MPPEAEPAFSEPCREQEKKTIYITDPSQYWQEFLKSDYYQNEVKRRRRIIAENNPERRNDSIVRREAILFLKQRPELMEQSLYRFYYNRGIKLRYDDQAFRGYSQEFRIAIRNYWAKIRELERKMLHEDLSDDEVKTLDEERAVCHVRATRQLTRDGLAPNQTIAKAYVAFMTESAGMSAADYERENRRAEVLAENMARGA